MVLVKSVVVFASAVVAAGAAAASEDSVPATATTSSTLRAAASRHGRFFGAALNAGHLSSDAAYSSLAASQYSLVTAENACKWGSIRHSRDSYDFEKCDAVRDFTLGQLKGKFRGHNLCWGNNNPSWLTSIKNGAELRAALVSHITNVTTHYGADAYAWDVVNEALTDSYPTGTFKSNTWYPAVPDYVDVAFRAAYDATKSLGDKRPKLFYNDYNVASATGWSKHKSDLMYNMTKGMLARGIPIDGVGLQMHLKSGYSADMVEGIRENMKRLGALGLEVHVTELDISIDGDATDKALEEQAQLYASLLRVCLDVPACKNFETWGYTDKYTWKGTASHPLPFDENFKEKPAVGAMLAEMEK